MRNPGNPAKADPLIFEFSRFLLAGLAVDAVRIDLAIVDAPGFFRKALADVIAVGLDLPPHFDQRGAELCRGDWRGDLPRSAEARRHYRFLDRGLTAFGAGDLAGLLLRLEPVSVTKPPFELVAMSTAQRKQDHLGQPPSRQLYTGPSGLSKCMPIW